MVERDGRIIVSSNSNDPTVGEYGYSLIRPWAVANQIPEMQDRVDRLGVSVDVCQHSRQRRQVCVNVRDQCISHWSDARVSKLL